MSSLPDYSIMVQNIEYTVAKYEVICEAIQLEYESRDDFHQERMQKSNLKPGTRNQMLIQ